MIVPFIHYTGHYSLPYSTVNMYDLE